MRSWLSGARAFRAAAVIAFLSGCSQGDVEGGGGGGGAFEFPPTAVEVAPVESGAVENVFETIGTLQAGETVTIVSEIDAIAVRFPFREGDPIEKGDPIALLDDAELSADLARVAALRDQRKASHDRVVRVVEQGAASPQDLDDATAALRVAEADVALARARLNKTRITVPFSGVVGPREVSPGAFLRAGQPITQLAQVSELKVVFSVPERYAGELTRGAEVTVSTTAYPGYQLTGRVDVVDPILEAATRTVRVIARVQNPDGRFLPGMSANVRAVLSSRDSALTIPSEAVFAQGDQFFAYTVQEDGSVAQVPLRLGVRLARTVEILDGLQAGDQVIRAGHQKLFPGSKVFAVNSQNETVPTGGDKAASAATGAAPEAAGTGAPGTDDNEVDAGETSP